MIKREEFPILLIGMHDFVEGNTRLQKYAFLSSMRIKELSAIKLYNDWRADNFGPFSPNLAKDIDTVLINKGIEKFPVLNQFNSKVDRFTVSEKGKEIFKNLKSNYSNLYTKILDITQNYQGRSLSQLLQDVYFLYPEYTNASKIRAKIGRKNTDYDPYLSREFD